MIILRGYYPEKYTGKDKYIKFLFKNEKPINIFHDWNILNYFHPKFTYLFKLLDVYILYSIKVFICLFFFSMLKTNEDVVIDSQENIFLVDLTSKFKFKSISIVFYDFASSVRILNKKDYVRLQKVDKIIVMSEQIKAELLLKAPGIIKNKIRVIPYKSEKKIFKAWSREEINAFRIKHDLPEKYLLYVGSEQERKNFFTLLRAFELLMRKDDNLYLIKIGKDQARTNRKKIKDQLKVDARLERRFMIIEDCPERELVGYYNCANLLIFPSLYEGFGIPLVEAMACYVPVVASNIPTNVEVCGNTAIYFKNLFDPVELKNKITYLLDGKNNMKYRKLSAERSKRFVY